MGTGGAGWGTTVRRKRGVWSGQGDVARGTAAAWARWVADSAGARGMGAGERKRGSGMWAGLGVGPG
jgi:hypothetical protein